MNWISLAFRNLLRNARRSITTIAAVSLGYAAVNILAGFAAYMFASIEDAHIYEQAYGQIQIWRVGAQTYGGSDPTDYLISAKDYEAIQLAVKADERVQFATGMLEVQGSVDAEGKSGFFVGQAMVPSLKEEIQGQSTALRSPEETVPKGTPITDEAKSSVAIASGMAKALGLEVGSPVVLMAASPAGQMNAVDAEVHQIIETMVESLDNRYIFLPLSLAQDLYDTDQVSSVRILLRRTADTDAVVASLREKFPESEWEIIPWYQSSKLYLRTKRMFDIIFGLVFVIITVIVTMSVLNTIGMAVIERTKEIGTLRALGLKRGGVILLFGIESTLLGMIGAVIGLLMTLTFAGIVMMIAPAWEPPVTAGPMIWEIRILPVTLLITLVLLVIFTALAAVAPARRAAKQSIVDSLGHV